MGRPSSGCRPADAMPVDVGIIVSDTPPRITLAAVKSLDYLLYPALPVIIPDTVFVEATKCRR